MANNKIMILAVLTVLVVGLSACDGGQRTTGKVFSGGTNGLLFSLERDAPPDLIYDNGQTPFGIIVRAKNDGEFDTEGITFTVSGINRLDFPGLVTPVVDNNLIIGRTTLENQVIDGDEAYITLANDVRYQRRLAGGGELDFAVVVDACYPYATLATSKVCLQEDYLDGNNDICDPRTSSEISVSGAPIQITSFQQQPVGTDRLRVQYEFTLRNNVEIWAPLSGGTSGGQDCRPSDRSERVAQQNWIYVEVDPNLPGANVECVNLVRDRPSNFDGRFIKNIRQAYIGGPTAGSIIINSMDPDGNNGDSGWLRLGTGDKVTLTCTMDVPEVGNSFGTVDVLATYYVKDRVSRTLTVTHSNT